MRNHMVIASISAANAVRVTRGMVTRRFQGRGSIQRSKGVCGRHGGHMTRGSRNGYRQMCQAPAGDVHESAWLPATALFAYAPLMMAPILACSLVPKLVEGTQMARSKRAADRVRERRARSRIAAPACRAARVDAHAQGNALGRMAMCIACRSSIHCPGLNIGRRRRLPESPALPPRLIATRVGRLVRRILLIPSWEGPSADPEEKRGPGPHALRRPALDGRHRHDGHKGRVHRGHEHTV